MNNHLLASDISEIVEDLGDLAHEFAGKTVLLSGGMGFLGRYFTAIFAALNRDVLAEPVRLLVLDNFITSRDDVEGDRVGDNVRLFRHDVIEPFEHDGPIEFVIHAAGIASPFYYREYPLETLEVSVLGTKSLLQLARQKGARFLYFSTSEIYGDPDPTHVPTPESYRGNVSCLGPRACYDESKRLGETLCRIYHEQFGVHTTMLRPFNVFGPGMREQDYRVLPRFASHIVGGHPLTVYGSGNQTRTYCYVSDAMSGFTRALLRGVPGEPYNIGNPTPEISVVDLVERMGAVLGRRLDYNLIEYPDTYPADEPNRRCPDIRKARLQLDYEPRVELNEGLRRFLIWAQENYTGEA